MSRPRLRSLGLDPGGLPPGPLNSLTDVNGVRVGHCSVVFGEGALVPGRGPARTGITLVLPHGGNLFHEKVSAAVHTINGFGKTTGFEQVRELGVIEAPIALTNTLNVGRVLDALVSYCVEQNPEIGVSTGTVNIVVGETSDAWLNDIQGRHVTEQHVRTALANAAPGAFELGSVGAGSGTVCYGWKGGIGTASRVLPAELNGYTLGALVQSNFGKRSELRFLGRTYCPSLGIADPEPQPTGGSVMIVLATDAPLDSRQLGRICRRAAAGLARTGSTLGHGSGDFVIAFSTSQPGFLDPRALAGPREQVLDEARLLDPLFQAVVESVEEAVLDSLCTAETSVGRDGHTAYELPTGLSLGRVLGLE